FAAQRHLPAFPTRRSSDLTDGFAFPALGLRTSRLLRFWDFAISECLAFILPNGEEGDLARNWLRLGRIVLSERPVGIRMSLQKRSEEHTSELQSRENLVCR